MLPPRITSCTHFSLKWMGELKFLLHTGNPFKIGLWLYFFLKIKLPWTYYWTTANEKRVIVVKMKRFTSSWFVFSWRQRPNVWTCRCFCLSVPDRTAVHDQQTQSWAKWSRRRGGGGPEWTLWGPGARPGTVHRETRLPQQVSVFF